MDQNNSITESLNLESDESSQNDFNQSSSQQIFIRSQDLNIYTDFLKRSASFAEDINEYNEAIHYLNLNIAHAKRKYKSLIEKSKYNK